MSSDNAQFGLGDTVWIAECGNQQVEKVCPVCFGTLRVTLRLGNGDELELPCDYCGMGYDGPQGHVLEYEWTEGARQATITRVRENHDTRGIERELYASSWEVTDRAFATEKEALAKSAELKAQNEERQRTCAEHIKKSVNKSFSWNAGYHIREAKRCRREAAQHDERAKLCKARAKAKGDADGSTSERQEGAEREGTGGRLD